LDSLHPLTKREAHLRIGLQDVVADYTVSPLITPGYPVSLLIEIQALDRLLRISREEAQITNHQATRALIRGMAHEIKNPLGGIRGAAQLLEKAPAGTDISEYTHIIIEEADRLRNLADRLLGPRALPKMRQVNIHECMERVRALLLVEAAGRVQVRIDYDPSLPELKADPDQLIQALLNIGGNALQALLENPNQSELAGHHATHPTPAPVHHRRHSSPTGAARGHRGQRPRHSRGADGNHLLSHGQWPCERHRPGAINCPGHRAPVPRPDRMRVPSGAHPIQHPAAV
jgi:nitrogen-specific signal transduction histidine kinase